MIQTLLFNVSKNDSRYVEFLNVTNDNESHAF